MNEKAETYYEIEYHLAKHKHLYKNPRYYKARSELARKRYFGNIYNLSKKRVLEFGIGLGQNLYSLPTKKKVGYDVSKFAVKYSKEKGILSTTNIDKIPDDTFDIVFSAHVLEHVDNPLKTLRVMHSKLRKDGKLILITPINVLKKTKNKNLKPDVNQHLYTWNPQQMVNLLIKAGFSPIENKIIPTYAYKKLLFFRRFGLWTYDRVTRLAGKIKKDRELKFVAVKI